MPTASILENGKNARVLKPLHQRHHHDGGRLQAADILTWHVLKCENGWKDAKFITVELS
jgi:hypothetical protein